MKAWIIAFLFTLFISSPSQAHPHIFITPKATFIMNDHFISQINVEWDFDDMSSALFAESCGSNTAGIWSLVFPATQILANGSQVSRTSYYTYVEIDGIPVGNLTPENFSADFVNGSLRCKFTVSIRQNAGNTIRLWFDDPTIYNAFDIQRGNFQVLDQSGALPVLRQVTENDIDKISLAW